MIRPELKWTHRIRSLLDLRFRQFIRPNHALNRFYHRQAERIIADILKPVDFQKTEQSAALKQHHAEKLSIYSTYGISERAIWRRVGNSEFWRDGEVHCGAPARTPASNADMIKLWEECKGLWWSCIAKETFCNRPFFG